MKKYFLHIILILIVVLSACKKIPFDKRNKYVGSYHFVNSYYTWNMTPYQSPTISEEYWGRVYYNKSDEKNIIHIEFSGSWDMKFTIDSDGNISHCGGNGKFSDRNNVSLNYTSSSCPGTGLGGGIVYHVTGEKKNK